MNTRQTQNNNLAVPTTNTNTNTNSSSIISNNNNNEEVEMISDRSLSPNFSTDNNSTASYEPIVDQQSNNSSHFSQVMDDDDSILTEDDQNDSQYQSQQDKHHNNTNNHNHITMKPINNQHHQITVPPTTNKPKHCNDNNIQQKQQQPHVYDFRITMIKNGFQPQYLIAKTLQGSIWKVYYPRFRCHAVIKITNKVLTKKHIGIDHINKQYVYGCTENIYNEIQMLHILNNPALNQTTPKPQAMISLYKVFEDNVNVFVVMEYGGQDLLQFINECHFAIRNSKMYIHEWQQTAKLMMKQICQFINWLHNEKNIAHLDISLENMLITNIQKEYDPITKTYKISPTFQIKFCDFGLAELFTKTKRQIQQQTAAQNPQQKEEEEEDEEEEYYFNEFDSDFDEDSEEEEEEDLDEISFECRKFVGKMKYGSPEIFNRMTFDARKADIWALGVVFFMICIGTAPWNIPCDKTIANNPKMVKDLKYDQIVNKQDIMGVLQEWGRHHYIDQMAVNLLKQMFADHMYRIDANQILSHPWLQIDDE